MKTKYKSNNTSGNNLHNKNGTFATEKKPGEKIEIIKNHDIPPKNKK